MGGDGGGDGGGYRNQKFKPYNGLCCRFTDSQC